MIALDTGTVSTKDAQYDAGDVVIMILPLHESQE